MLFATFDEVVVATESRGSGEAELMFAKTQYVEWTWR